MQANYTTILEKISFSLIGLKKDINRLNITDKPFQERLLQIRLEVNNLKQLINNSTEKHVSSGKLRSVDETYNLLISCDPETAITKSGLRRLIANGTLPCVKVGRNIKLNVDKVIEILNIGSTTELKTEPMKYGGIKRISE